MLLALVLVGSTLPLADTVLAQSSGAVVGKLTGSHEVPAVASPGFGSAQVQVVGSLVFYQVSLSGMTAAPTGGEIRLAAIGANGPVAFALPATNGSLSGQISAADLSPTAGVTFDQAVTAILSGGAYVNVLTAAHPTGELRGQLESVPSHPAYTIGAGTPPGGTGDFTDFFPRTLTVAAGTTLRLIVGPNHTASLLPAGEGPTQDVQPNPVVTLPAGCGTDTNPCVFDGTTVVSAGPSSGTPAQPFVVYIGAPIGTYVIHSRLQPTMIGSIQVVAPGSPAISSLDDIALEIAGQLGAESPPPPPGSMYSGRAGNDISYPDCPHPLPGVATIGIIGVNDGRPYTRNPCLAAEFAWAGGTGLTGLYVNTQAAYGPSATHGSTGPAGTCAKTDHNCQGYNYGYNAAKYAWTYAVQQLGAANVPSVWWLDIEIENTWFTNSPTSNASSIQGALDFLGTAGRYGAPSMGLTVGIYSTTLQFQKITGTTFRPGVPVWYATVETTAQAALGRCGPMAGNPNSFTGGPVWLVQYLPGGFDTDVGCP